LREIAGTGIDRLAGASGDRWRACARPKTDPYSWQTSRLGSDLESLSGEAMAAPTAPHLLGGCPIPWMSNAFLERFARTSLLERLSRTSVPNACDMSLRMMSSDPSVSAALDASAIRMGNDENRSGGPSGPAASVITKVKPKTKRPNLYRVLILNDDYTPMEFVVHVLEKFFQKDVEAATKIMLHVHHHGIGECGIFTYEIAETKVTQVMDFARKHQHPLQCVMEKK
jgi:ATP-dependent Clp protease adaptor protein ClpS